MDIHAPETFNHAELVGLFNVHSPQWHAARMQGLGGSDIGTICGLNKWESAYTLWAKRTGQIPEEQLTGWAVRLGQAFEDPILELFQEEEPTWDIYKTGTYRHKDYPFMTANPDALAYDRDTDRWWIVEVKTSRYEWDSIPPAYLAQVQHYMFVMGIDRAVIVSLQGMQWKEYPIQADDFEQQNQLTMATKFWEKIQAVEKPDWDGSESTYQTVRKMNTDLQDNSVDIGELGIVVWNAQRKFDEAQEELNKAKSATLDAMGSARYAVMEEDGVEHLIATRHTRANTSVLTIKR